MITSSNREELILAHMPEVELLARRLHRRCPQDELDDLISAGTIGLIQAVPIHSRTLEPLGTRGSLISPLNSSARLGRNTASSRATVLRPAMANPAMAST